MKLRARFLVEMALIVSAVGCLAAVLNGPKDSKQLKTVKLPSALIAVESPAQAEESEEGPLIPQISRPIYRYAPVEYRDAFSPLTRPAAHRRLQGCKPLPVRATGAHFRDPFRVPPLDRGYRRPRIVGAAPIPTEIVHFRS